MLENEWTMRNLPLHWKIILGLLLGIAYSFFSSFMGWNDFTTKWINPFGDIFIRLLKFIAVPLVLFSIISGVASLPDPSRLGRMGAKTLLAYLLTTVIAVTVGLLLVNIAQPGKFIAKDQRIKNRIKYELWVERTPQVEILDGQRYLQDPAYADEISSLSSEFDSEMAQVDQKVSSRLADAEKLKSTSPLQFVVDLVPENIFRALSDGKLMLQVIFFGVFFGIMLIIIPDEKANPVRQIVEGVNEVFLKMVDVVMQAAPFFVFALMAGVIAQMAETPAEVVEIFKGLLSYSLAVVAGLLILVFGFYPLLMALLVRTFSYKEFFRRISPAQFLAFSTSSSAATLPVTMECVRDGLGVSNNVTNFVLPIGATVNMDGTSLYQAVAVVFLAQMHLVDLTVGQQITIVLTATLASIGSAAVPSAGLVMMIVVLQSVGLNPAWIAIVFPVDRILDMCRTVVNVTGDATVSSIIAKSEGELNPQP